jgi:anti-anti-sigma factor
MFEIRHGAAEGEVVVSGRLDAAQCERALRFLDAVPAPRVIDLAGLDYISSAGLGVLLKTQKRAMAGGQGVKLVNANRHIRDILRYAGFDRIFDIAPAATDT